MTLKSDVHHRTFWKVVPKFYDRYRLKDLRKFPKLSRRLIETVDLKISRKVDLKYSEEKPWKWGISKACRSKSFRLVAKPEKNVVKIASRNFAICTILQLSTFSGIHEENLKDPFTFQKQVVNRITTLVKPMSLWSPVDNSSMNPSAVQATARWQTAHGKLKIRSLS